MLKNFYKMKALKAKTCRHTSIYRGIPSDKFFERILFENERQILKKNSPKSNFPLDFDAPFCYSYNVILFFKFRYYIYINISEVLYMKNFKRALALILCVIMLASTVMNDSLLPLLQPIKASAIADHKQNYNDARVELDFNKGWLFSFSDDSASYLKGFNDSSWEKIDLPHDFSMSQEFTTEGTEDESGNLPGGTGWYRKWFNLYDYYDGDDVILNFDGAYQHTYVYVNGKYVGENHYGYNSFSFEISDYLINSNTALNLIAVKVVNDIPSSRWYTGSGIYRDVSLTITGSVHVSLYGPQVTTPNIATGDGTAKAAVAIHNDTAITKKVTVETTILDSNLNAVSNTVSSSLITIPAETEQTVVLEPKVNSPVLWTLDNPTLYKLKTVIKNEASEIIDEYHTTFGYRYISWDADNGFCFNGEYIKLKGACLHHDQGAIGATQEYESIYRQIVTLKEMGCNAIRTSHNSASRVVIDICNELGMLVIEEFFDGWDSSKNYNSNDFSKYFNQEIPETNTAIGAHGQKWFEYVIEQTMLRDRHDPCVIAWDIGNELGNITEGESTSNYQAIVADIVAITDKLDPSRAVLQGNNAPYREELVMIDGYMDVIGGNYAPDSWATVMTDPNDPRSSKPFVSTEAASALSSRGVYDTMTSYDYQCTSYDTYAVSWGNEAAEAWYAVATNDWYSGEFIWTGFDYIGEPTPWNNMGPASSTVPNSSYFGVVDTAGFEKDSFYLYRSLWNEKDTTLHLVPGSWNDENLLLTNGYVNVAVYSNAKKIELLLNGNVIATATSTVNTTNAGYTYKTWTESIVDSANCSVGNFYTGNGADFYPQFSVKYTEGELSVKAYDESNNEITNTVGSKKSVTGTATQVAVTTWQNKDTFVADGADYIYVEFEARDAAGNFMNDYNGTISVKVDEDSARYAKIVGVDNGNAATTAKFQQKSALTSDAHATIQMFNGRALVILRTTEEEGTINVTAIATDGDTSFSTQGITVTSEKEAGVDLTDEFEEVILQNGKTYVPTLFDEQEMVKHHVNGLVPPSEGGASGSDDKLINYEIYLADTTVSEGCVANGDYVIFNQDTLMSTELFWEYTHVADSNIKSKIPSSSGSYPYDGFRASDANIFTFTHIGNNDYYIQNKITGQYVNVGEDQAWKIVYSSTPKNVHVEVTDKGAILISSPDYYVCHYTNADHFYVATKKEVQDVGINANYAMWLYNPKPYQDNYSIYIADSSASEGCIQNGEYVIDLGDYVLSDDWFDGWTVAGDKTILEVEDAPSGAAYPYTSFDTSEDNIYIFTHIGENQYYIQNKKTGQYLYRNGWSIQLGSEPFAFDVDISDDGSVLIHTFFSNVTLYVSRRWEYFELIANSTDNAKIWLYSKPNSNNSKKVELYNALLEGVKIDYSSYTKASYETLLAKLEEGVAVYNNPDATDAELIAATEAINAAIAALSMDVKKINGTLFKYGYNNSTGTADYSDGGTLINAVAVKQMKNAILADENLVNQIKEIIGYDDPNLGWANGRADEVLEEAAELYAKIYTLQFTGKPTNDSNNSNAVSNFSPLSSYTTIPLTLWNVWTKDNTHGVDDPVLAGSPVHDGASVQGLASATLTDSVVTSHSAYSDPLSYANDGPEPIYDITEYEYYFNTGTKDQTVTLEYLSGISVYFPDLFSRESLDANGNVTTATSGQFSKYYWDTEFPMFISTDEYGVNTYHFDSKDTQYLVQASFDDVNHTVDMDLNDVGYWNAYGSHSGSGFFPFNYKQGTTAYTGENAIYHYGFTFEHDFYIPKGGKHVNGEDVIFTFSGDDDVLVYVDGVLVLDNGGLHGARSATINFTNCTITYQYAMDVADGKLKGGEYETTYSYNDYVESPEKTGYNADTIAAINKLHDVITDGEVHTLNFFYLERGASDSNCRISFNLSETSEEVKIIDQTLTLDYGLPVEFDITTNNRISQAAIDNNVKIEYLGICAINEDYTPTYTFEKPEIIIPFEDGVTYTIEGMDYGTCTIDKKGNVKYTVTSTNMKDSENFFVCVKITGDPTYAEEVVYYQVEKTTFVPATAIYYEDTFDTITYTNGSVATNYDNSTNQYGIWKTHGEQSTTLKQAADVTDSEANPYGYETNYMSFAEYSGGSIHYVDVSTKNNPNSKFSGGTGGAWPTVNFTFTGTGFDLISITDCTTGAFSVMVKDKNNRVVASSVVDTFYGYNYGQIFSDENGLPSLDSTLTPMYKSEEGGCTSDKRYYDENGALTDVPHYYDADKNVTETETSSPAYAYAYGWVIADENSKETLYQIPVMKITNLEYGNYSVVITPTFTSAFRHSSTAADGTSYYRVYLDAIKIYSPAGINDGITDPDVKTAYSTDDELYPSYLELKDMLIGADSLSETDTQGVIFIDGIAALDNDIETYRNAGPNNELYLAKDQAVAFEIWATSVPTDIQLGTKLACGEPTLTVSYASETTAVNIKTATDIYYSLNTVLPNDSKLTWRLVKGSDGNNYYTTGTVVVQNTGKEDSVLSVTNLKWTFSETGAKGYFRIPTSVAEEELTLAATSATPPTAYSLMRMRTAALDTEQVEEPAVVTDENGNSVITVKLKTSTDVDHIVVTDENGNPLEFEFTAAPIEGEDAIEWTVTFSTNEAGTHTYTVAGAYENGYTDESKSVSFSVTIEEPEKPEEPVEPDEPTTDPDNEPDEPNEPGNTDDGDSSVLDVIVNAVKRVYNLLINLAKAVLELIGVTF